MVVEERVSPLAAHVGQVPALHVAIVVGAALFPICLFSHGKPPQVSLNVLFFFFFFFFFL
ncbi:uncharacterized protein IWZ02DRAFT_446238, partial [Phyllosticta citriasiana]|uniref:uncharacterized protein n=1 Tax=Phyllosticta citriasiana TaxID=595635 RepID=UPI0030FDB372